MEVLSRQRNSRMCVICGLDNPVGLRAGFYNMKDGSVMCPFKFKEEYQSFPQRVHGGIIATMLDELAFRALWTNGTEDVWGVTMSMNVKYRKPVPYETPLIGRGIIVRETSKFATMDAQIFNIERTLLANAEVKYIKLSADQIASGIDVHDEMCYLVQDNVKEINFDK